MGLTWKVHPVFRRQHTVNMGCTDTEVDVHIWCGLRLNGIPSTCSCSCSLKLGKYTRSIQWHCACQQVTTTIMQYVQDWTTCVNLLAATSSSYILNTSYTHSRLPCTGITGSCTLFLFFQSQPCVDGVMLCYLCFPPHTTTLAFITCSVGGHGGGGLFTRRPNNKLSKKGSSLHECFLI